MDNEVQPSIASIKKNEYHRLAEHYRPLFVDKPATEFKLALTDKTNQLLDPLPDSDKTKVLDFSQRVANRIPEVIFSDMANIPTSREGIKTLIAHAYNIDDEAKKDTLTRDQYIRALSALSGNSISFSNGNNQTNTREIIDEFFDGNFTRENFYNFLTQLNAETMPISNTNLDKRTQDKVAFDIFFEKTRNRSQKAMDIFVEYCQKYVPDKVKDVISWKDDIVCVESISRFPISTNDPELNSESNYGSAPAGAVAFGIDPISNLSLTVIDVPNNFHEVTRNKNILPKEDPSYIETLTFIHESLHNVTPDRNFSGDYMYLINELLTETSSWIVALKSEGQDFLKCPDEYFVHSNNYFDLVLLAGNLMKNGFITQDEIVDLGLRQDPKGFMDVISQRISQSNEPEKITNTMDMLLKRFLIKPRKEAEVPLLVEQFKANPSLFMQNEFMEMWDLVGSQYLGQKWYLNRIIEEYRAKHQDVSQEESYSAIRRTNGVLVDECVDTFYGMDESQKLYRDLFLRQEKFIEQMEESSVNINLSDLKVLNNLKIHNNESETVMDLEIITNKILRLGLDHYRDWSDSERFKMIVDTSHELYEGISKIVEKNWEVKGIRYTRDDIFSLLNNVAPAWLSWRDPVRDPSGVVQKIISRFDNLTSPIDTPDGEAIFGPQQLTHWGAILEQSDLTF